MSNNLSASREQVVRERLVRFDLGASVRSVDHWAETMRDALSCTVYLGGGREAT